MLWGTYSQANSRSDSFMELGNTFVLHLHLGSNGKSVCHKKAVRLYIYGIKLSIL